MINYKSLLYKCGTIYYIYNDTKVSFLLILLIVQLCYNLDTIYTIIICLILTKK